MIHNPLTEILWGIKSKIDRLGQNERLKCPNDKNTLYRTGLSCHRLLKKLFTFQPPDRSLLTWLIRRLDLSRLFWCLLLSSSLIGTINVCSWIRNPDTSSSVIVRTVFSIMRGLEVLKDASKELRTSRCPWKWEKRTGQQSEIFKDPGFDWLKLKLGWRLF